jgi:hypothetical protein
MKHQFFTRRVAVLTSIVVAPFTLLLIVLFVTKSQKPVQFGRVFGKHRRHPATEADVVRISEWMTFEYINTVFDLPPNYLKDTLHIDDAKYPSITLGQYATKVGIDSTTFTVSVRRSVEILVHKPKA